jgi:16S rRNA (guanine527-N7)-methyltransferase
LTADLPAACQRALDVLLELLDDPRAPISASSAGRAREVHIADSLSGLELEPVASARRLADLGSGAGLPGLVLAASLPDAQVDVIESSGRKCEFLREAIERMRLENATVVCERSEDWAREGGREAYGVVTARAVGSLPVVAELASPLLSEGGVLAAWKGARAADEENALARAAGRLAMEPVEVRPVTPYPGSRDRHIHLLRKNGPTPNELPRRPGMAAKRPFGTEST